MRVSIRVSVTVTLCRSGFGVGLSTPLLECGAVGALGKARVVGRSLQLELSLRPVRVVLFCEQSQRCGARLHPC
eukprot:scaffold46566_cov35-Phaeocystis_antarctica.AAC.4